MCFKPKKQITNSMELNAFISNALSQLIDGITTAQEYAKSKGASINPSDKFVSDYDKISRTEKLQPVNIVEFDIVVTVGENKAIQGGIGIVVPEVSMGYQAKIDTQKSAVSRIKFSIPVMLPIQNNKE
jgi:hypothetical protein